MKNALINSVVYVLVFLCIQICVTLGVRYGWQTISGSEDISADMLIATMTLFAILTIAVFIFARWFVVDKSYANTRPWGAMIWCALAAFGLIIPSLWFQEQMPELPDFVSDDMNMILKNPAGYIAVGLMAPIAEEIVFRGAILKSLLGGIKSHWAAICISAVLFALVHANPAQMPHAFLAGLLLGWMYYRTGSIIPGLVYHWVNNTIAFIMCYLMPDPDIPLVVLFNGSQTRVAIAVISSLLIFLPSLYQLTLRLKRPDAKRFNR